MSSHTCEPKLMSRSSFLRHLSVATVQCSDTSFTLGRIGEKFTITITEAAPYVLTVVMEFVKRGSINSYDVSVTNGGVQIVFADAS